ncbi:hypothetical protein DKK78_09230 [Gilliamella apis]|uniref:Uncharacterized protein n=1 Tax=Gilliamella apis TaxID=1970738 RepID=A0A2V4DLW8_9GAMM|nr:hypothetical protein DKK78_09230 [Gilliamella apis]
MANRDVWQSCSSSGTNTAGALTANEGGMPSHRDHLVATGVGKEGRANPLYSDIILVLKLPPNNKTSEIQ